jgi:hypothetical protein
VRLLLLVLALLWANLRQWSGLWDNKAPLFDLHKHGPLVEGIRFVAAVKVHGFRVFYVERNLSAPPWYSNAKLGR